MEILGIGIVVAIIAIIISAHKKTAPQVTKKTYHYSKKTSIATRVEQIFYHRLVTVIDGKYQIIPQVHLSGFINHKIKGQNWRGAFSVINGKSVDFLICDKYTLAPIVAVELDDASHMEYDRVMRDTLVESILEQAQMPLVRYRQGEWDTEQQISAKLAAVLNK